MYPTLENIREIAAKGQYKRVPVCREVYADRYTPVEVMRTLRKASRHCYLLESASQTEVWGRYSFLGYEPVMEITCTDGYMKIRHTEVGNDEVVTKQVAHPGDTLREILKEYKSPVMEEMPPFTGGLVGYFSYDYIKYSEPKLKLGEHEDPDFRDMDLMLFDQVIAFDHYRQKVLLITGVMLDDLEKSYQKAEKKLQEMGARNVLISMAGEGAVLIAEDGQVFDKPAPKGHLVNAVGAGDSMVAGFMAGWMDKQDYEHAFCMGIASGSASAFSEYLATKSEIEAIYKQVRVED